MIVAVFDLTAQGIFFEEGVTIRYKQKSHHFKMVDWDDTQYKEFAYWKETEYGSIIDFMNWRAAFPPGYDKGDSLTRYSAIVAFAGNGSSGRVGHESTYDNNSSQLGAGGLEHLKAINSPVGTPGSFPGIAIYPQVSYGGAWTGENLLEVALIIEYMIREYHLDPDKIYLHGLSNGGRGAWDMATERPDLFAAILPMSGVGSDLDSCTDSVVTTPIWLFQGEIDINPSKEWSRQWIDLLLEKGSRPRYTVYRGIGHGTWFSAYVEPDFFSWMQEKDKKQIYVFNDSLTECVSPDVPLKLGFSAGFLDYQWMRSGESIVNEKSRYHTSTIGGIYTVQFKRRTDSLWAESYPVVVGDGSPVSLNATSSVALPLPEGSDQSLKLEAPKGARQYEWYKDGSLITTTADHFLMLDDEEGRVFQPSDSGIYTVRIPVDVGCPFAESNPIKVTYSEVRPEEVRSIQVSAEALSSSEVLINWTDFDQESYYEVWRQRVNTLTGEHQRPPGYASGKFVFLGLISANTTTFTDEGLRPGAGYVYRIRIIVEGTRGSIILESGICRTSDDTAPPSAPSELVANKNERKEIHLYWQASTDDDVVYAYEIFDGDKRMAVVRADTLDADMTDGSPSAPTDCILTGLSEGVPRALKVRAVDYSGLNSTGNSSGFSNTVEIEAVLGTEPFSVFPNPFDSRITIQTLNPELMQQRLILYDMGARGLYDQPIPFKGGKALMDFGHLRAGLYMLQVGDQKFRIIKSD